MHTLLSPWGNKRPAVRRRVKPGSKKKKSDRFSAELQEGHKADTMIC